MIKYFLDWKVSYESFNDLPLSNKFEEDYAPDFVVTKEKNEKMEELNSFSVLLGSSNDKIIRFLFNNIIDFLGFIKTENINLDPIVNLDRDLSISLPLSSFLIDNTQIKNILG